MGIAWASSDGVAGAIACRGNMSCVFTVGRPHQTGRCELAQESTGTCVALIVIIQLKASMSKHALSQSKRSQSKRSQTKMVLDFHQGLLKLSSTGGFAHEVLTWHLPPQLPCPRSCLH